MEILKNPLKLIRN